MSKSTDERGRIYLPKAVRQRFGDRFRIVELPSHVALFPVDDEPLAGLDAAVGGAFKDEDRDDLKADARASISKQVREDVEHRPRDDEP